MYEFVAVVHRIAMFFSPLNCDEMVGDRPRQPAHEIFSIKCRF